MAVVLLKSKNGETFEVSLKVAKEMQIVKNFVEEESFVPANVFPLLEVHSSELSLIISYLNFHHQEVKPSENEAKEFNKEFVKNVSHEQLLELLLAANYLDAPGLLEFLLQTVAGRIENKGVQFVRNFFGVENDFTAEEEEKLLHDTAWAHQGVDPDV